MTTSSSPQVRSPDPTISVVIPAKNEARNLEAVLPELDPAYEVIVVDGGSVDGTDRVTHRIRPDSVLIGQNGIGKGNALMCGFRVAGGDIIVTLDADGSADPAEIPRYVDALRGGADFAKGSRFRTAPGVPAGSEDLTRLRRWGNSALVLLSNALLRARFSDLCYGYNAFWRDVLPALELPDERFVPASRRMLWSHGFEIEALLACRAVRAGMRIVEVPSMERARLHGTTNLRTFTDGARVLRTLLVEYGAIRTHGRLRHVPDRWTGEVTNVPRNRPLPADPREVTPL